MNKTKIMVLTSNLTTSIQQTAQYKNNEVKLGGKYLQC